jgi:predicted nucleic acid-binding protein
MDWNRSAVNAVVDTNVIAYLLLGTERFADEARDFMTVVEEAWAPSVWEAELANVLWMATRHKVLSLEEAARRLTSAAALGVHAVSNRTLWQGALVRAHHASIPVYDTLFVELAVREGLPLATFDATLLKAFPDVAVRPRAAASK